jgi:pyrimidine-nucleoside phosphorylase
LKLWLERLDPPVTIARKRDGEELPADELRAFLTGYLAGDVAEEQMSAFLMAGVIRGFTRDEAVTMTEVFVASGDVVDLSALRGPTVDKHSTGGVGDTTTLVVGPLLATCGAQVAKLSGRGLGHTGGTLDKLESIPGFRVDLTPAEVRDQVDSLGLAVAAATADLVPLDKRLYALRDVTGTVPSPALIAASVMSKKLAGGAAHVLLDVKAGDGAFMEDPADAVALAELCVAIGEAHGRRTGALVTDMSQPLSEAVGNALEVAHAIEVLNGRREGRLLDLSIELAVAALQLTGRPADDARAAVTAALASGAAADLFRRFVTAQGGDAAVVDDPWALLPSAPIVGEWRPGAGRIGRIHCRGLGELASGLGAGRRHRDDDVDPRVGLEVLASIGDEIDDGQAVVRIHAASEDDRDWALERLPGLMALDGTAGAPPLVYDRVGSLAE